MVRAGVIRDAGSYGQRFVRLPVAVVAVGRILT
jgi:hypothetical protein